MNQLVGEVRDCKENGNRQQSLETLLQPARLEQTEFFLHVFKAEPGSITLNPFVIERQRNYSDVTVVFSINGGDGSNQLKELPGFIKAVMSGQGRNTVVAYDKPPEKSKIFPSSWVITLRIAKKDLSECANPGQVVVGGDILPENVVSIFKVQGPSFEYSDEELNSLAISAHNRKLAGVCYSLSSIFAPAIRLEPALKEALLSPPGREISLNNPLATGTEVLLPFGLLERPGNDRALNFVKLLEGRGQAITVSVLKSENCSKSDAAFLGPLLIRAKVSEERLVRENCPGTLYEYYSLELVPSDVTGVLLQLPLDTRSRSTAKTYLQMLTDLGIKPLPGSEGERFSKAVRVFADLPMYSSRGELFAGLSREDFVRKYPENGDRLLKELQTPGKNGNRPTFKDLYHKLLF